MARKPKGPFDDVLKEALDDIIDHGYDSAERLAYWQERLNRAARESMTPEAEIEEMLREALTDAWQRDVDRGVALRRHRGVSAFTIDKVKPALRNELSKRIKGSADLIKLDRNRVINETLQRFSGWVTSVPAGGSKAQDRKEERDKVRAGMSGLGFKERRVLIDQTHKLTSAVNDVIAKGGGAIAAGWKSHFHQAGYDYREEHKERELATKRLPYLIKGSWADEQGLVKLAGSHWTTDQSQPGEDIFCRCYFIYYYALSDLPREQLTKKGQQRLDEARRRMA